MPSVIKTEKDQSISPIASVALNFFSGNDNGVARSETISKILEGLGRVSNSTAFTTILYTTMLSMGKSFFSSPCLICLVCVQIYLRIGARWTLCLHPH